MASAGVKSVAAERSAAGPLRRTMARAPGPGADDRATMVSSGSGIMIVVRTTADRSVTIRRTFDFALLLPAPRLPRPCAPNGAEPRGSGARSTRSGGGCRQHPEHAGRYGG